MGDWAAKMHKKATSFGNVMTSCSYLSEMHFKRIEKVKFAIPFTDVCKDDNIPAPLLVLILKLNKEGPIRKDIFRAPGHLASVKKLIHYLENGVLVNIENFSVHTIASVLKKFLRKIPNGIFGAEKEQTLFQIIALSDVEQQCIETKRLILSLPHCTQRLLVMMFGTFRVIALNSSRYNTGMTSEAIGVSVAPSFFKSCVANGKIAKMEDVLKFKTATQIVQMLIDNFSTINLFGHQNYEYYTRITGRILKIDNEWICSFLNPSFSKNFRSEEDRTWLQLQCARPHLSSQPSEKFGTLDECLSLPTVVTENNCSISIVPEFILETCTRLSVSLNNNSETSSSNHSHLPRKHEKECSSSSMTGDESEVQSSKSWSFLPLVHERQTERMRNRSRWFLTPPAQCKNSKNVSKSADSVSHYTATKDTNQSERNKLRPNQKSEDRAILCNVTNRDMDPFASPRNATIAALYSAGASDSNGVPATATNTTTTTNVATPSAPVTAVAAFSSFSQTSTSVKRKLRRSAQKSSSFRLKFDDNRLNGLASGITAAAGARGDYVFGRGEGNRDTSVAEPVAGNVFVSAAAASVSLIRSNSCKQAKIIEQSITKSNSFNDRFCKCSVESLTNPDTLPFIRITST